MTIEQIFTAAMNGDIYAQYQLARHFVALGNQPKARYWLVHTAQKGHTQALADVKSQQASGSDHHD